MPQNIPGDFSLTKKSWALTLIMYAFYVGWSSRVAHWDSMKDPIVFAQTTFHKKLAKSILAPNSFWLVRNRVRHFGLCNYAHPITWSNIFGIFVAYCKGETNKATKVKQIFAKVASCHTESQMSDAFSRLSLSEMVYVLNFEHFKIYCLRKNYQTREKVVE